MRLCYPMASMRTTTVATVTSNKASPGMKRKYVKNCLKNSADTYIDLIRQRNTLINV